MNNTFKPIKYLAILFMASIQFALANNVKVENISLTNQNTTTDVKDIEFDISWENSWRTVAAPANWDACWIVAKYRVTTGSTWEHATLSSVDGDHTPTSGNTIKAVADGMGVYIYRDADGSGNNNFDNVRIRWDYGADGLVDEDSVEICVFAVEMIYIPDGNFELGDGDGTTTETTHAFELASSNNTPVSISTSLSATLETDASTTYDDAILGSTGIRLDGDGGIDEDNNGSVDHPNFPVGYNAIYCMKYEISQGQYVEFVNKLTSGQAANLIAITSANRENISGSGSVWSSTTPDRPKGMNWFDLCAYLDWMALRPMTETEYEKICRGTTAATKGEYAWGNTSIYTTAYTLNFDGTSSEQISNMGTSTGNANYNSVDPSGLVRCGIFAASSANNTREETGGTYYGVMEMSGNIYEQVVFLGDPDGRDFDGSNGDGEVHSSGYGNVAGWPGYDGATDIDFNDNGFTIRGGYYSSSTTPLRVSDRTYVNNHVTTRSSIYGGRGVRTE